MMGTVHHISNLDICNGEDIQNMFVNYLLFVNV